MADKRTFKELDLPQPIIQVDNGPQNDLQMNYTVNSEQMTNVWSYNLESGIPDISLENKKETSVNQIESLLNNHNDKSFIKEINAIERGQGGDTGDLVEKMESPKGERAVKPVISYPSEKWVLKIGFLKVQNW